MASAKLPSTYPLWADAAQQEQVHDGSIHAFTGALSASKIELPQYLLLRSIWKFEELRSTRSTAQPVLFSKYLSKESITVANNVLANSQDWQYYLEAIKQNQRTAIPGSMGLVRYYQHLCTSVQTTPEYEGNHKVDNSPMKLREKKKVAYFPDNPLDSPSEGAFSLSQQRMAAVNAEPRQDTVSSWMKTDYPLGGASFGLDAPSTPQNLTAALQSLAISRPPRKAITESNYSSNPEPDPDSGPEKNRAVKDEQIVNTALIILLNLLTISFECTQGEWSLYRQPFCVRNRNAEKVFKACVDGIYSINNDIISIVEVKPFARWANEKAAAAVSMQETAQMAAWISQHPPAAGTDSQQCTYRRLLLSQDRDEIFLTVASFSPTYVRYICDKMDANELGQMSENGFLHMDQQGPFNVDSSRQMDVLGKLLLAFCIQGNLEEDVRV